MQEFMTPKDKKAVARLWEIAANIATPEQILQVAREFDMEPHVLEGFYFDEIERAGDE